jgi:hypothetical protein
MWTKLVVNWAKIDSEMNLGRNPVTEWTHLTKNRHTQDKSDKKQLYQRLALDIPWIPGQISAIKQPNVRRTSTNGLKTARTKIPDYHLDKK